MSMEKYREMLVAIAKTANGKTIESVHQSHAKLAMHLLDENYHKLQVAKTLAKLAVEQNRDIREAKKRNQQAALLDKAKMINALKEEELSMVKESKERLQATKAAAAETEDTPTDTPTPTDMVCEDLTQ